MDRRDEYHELYSCYLKLRRVEYHTNALQRALDGFLGGNPYEIVSERHPQLGEHVLWTKVREEPPPEWSPVIGDIIHNWRSALDHLAYQLVVRNGRKPSDRTQFPIFFKDPFDSSLYTTTKKAKGALERWDRQVNGMHANDVAFLKRLQPYTRGHDPDSHQLSRLSRLSNWDKHREYQLTGQTLAGTAFNVKEWRNCEWWTLYEKPVGAFENGTTVARYAFTRTGPNPKMDVQIKVFFNVAFGKGSPLDGFGVKKTLLAIGAYVSDIIMEFKERFDKQDFSPPF